MKRFRKFLCLLARDIKDDMVGIGILIVALIVAPYYFLRYGFPDWVSCAWKESKEA